MATKPSSATAACAICASVPNFCHQKLLGCDIRSLRRDHMRRVQNAGIIDIRFMRVLIDAFLDLMTEMRDQALDRPCRSVAEGADGVALDLLCHFQQHVDLALVGAAFGHAGEHAPHPPGALTARRALAAALVLVE